MKECSIGNRRRKAAGRNIQYVEWEREDKRDSILRYFI
jgi:hypothetical protein